MGHYRVPDDVNHRILGHWPGDTFEADISEALETRLVARGQLIVGDKPRRKAPTPHVNRDQIPNDPSLIDAIQAATSPPEVTDP